MPTPAAITPPPPSFSPSTALLQQARRPRLLLCSAWQVVNIGDIAHTPGALALMEQHLPELDVTLWAYRPLSPAARALIKTRFPRVEIVEGELDASGEPTDPATISAIEEADFFLHGSGPAAIGWRHAEAFVRRTGRPFGVFGVTYGLYGCNERETLSRAAFVYFRDSASLALARSEGVCAPIMEWAPDTAFAFDVRDEARADTYIATHGLESGRFLCCISRLRYSPYWRMSGMDTSVDAIKHARNEDKKHADHAPLLDSIIAVARETPMKILLCPEDESQVLITREMLLDRLPADVRPRVVWRDTFWLPDEAAAVYRRSAGLFGHEMHSPILCIGQGIPAIVCRWAEQSTKGIMWRDIGLGDWLFDLDSPAETARVVPAVLALAREPASARARAAQAGQLVRERFSLCLRTVLAPLVSVAPTPSRQAPAIVL